MKVLLNNPKLDTIKQKYIYAPPSMQTTIKIYNIWNKEPINKGY